MTKRVIFICNGHDQGPTEKPASRVLWHTVETFSLLRPLYRLWLRSHHVRHGPAYYQ